MEVNPYLIQWLYIFLTGRTQIVRANQKYSTPIVTYSGAPQGCVSSPFLFSPDDYKAAIVNTYTFPDDTLPMFLLGIEDDSSMHQCCTDRLVEWCVRNLLTHLKKDKENYFWFKSIYIKYK